MSGTVIDVQVFTREGIERDKRAQQIIDDELSATERPRRPVAHRRGRWLWAGSSRLLTGKTANGGRRSSPREPRSTKAYLQDIERYHWFRTFGRLANEEAAQQLEQLQEDWNRPARHSMRPSRKKKRKLTSGDELPPACRRWSRFTSRSSAGSQPGDKMAGRHGNKG